jgi:hypothetical protein
MNFDDADLWFKTYHALVEGLKKGVDVESLYRITEVLKALN